MIRLIKYLLLFVDHDEPIPEEALQVFAILAKKFGSKKK